MKPSRPNKVFYLEMHSPNALIPSQSDLGIQTTIVNPPDASINRRFYVEIGAHWKWEDRLNWSTDKWQTHIEQDRITTGVGKLEHEDVGYVELEAQSNGDVEIVYFGLLNAYLGQGLGGALLTQAVKQAWNLPYTKRVWLHTCTQDHERALVNYQARGFELYKTEIKS